MFRIAICDDDRSFVQYEKSSIEQHMRSLSIPCEIICFDSGRELLSSIKNKDLYDLIILDVEFPDEDGMSIAYNIRLLDRNVPIAFVSAYISYSTGGYRVNAVRYIVKDARWFDEYMGECLDCVIETMKKKVYELEYDFTVGKRILNPDNIIYVESMRNYSLFTITGPSKEILKLRKPLKEVAKQLLLLDFVMLNPAILVNLEHLSSIKEREAVLSNGKRLQISYRKYNDVFKAFVQYKVK